MRWMSMVLLVGCVRVEQSFEDTLSSEGVYFVQLVTDQGSVAYDGRALDETFTFRGESIGRGDGRNKAAKREEGNSYDVRVFEDTLIASGTSQYNRASVNFELVGPGVMDTVTHAVEGRVQLENVEGVHVIDAESALLRNVVGDVDLIADGGGVDAQILPWTDVANISIISSGGDVTVGLPWGLDYDFDVIGDPDYPIIIDDLGFDTFLLDGVVGVGGRGFRTIRVHIDATGGEVQVYPL